MRGITIIDVAKEAGLSKSTVSRVIRQDYQAVRPDTQQRVLKAIHTLGYERNALASGLRTNRTHTVLCIIPDIVNPFWPEVARGVQDALRSAGFVMVLASSDWEDKSEIEFLKIASEHRFDGILINPSMVTNQHLLKMGIPTVILGLHEQYPDFDSVGNDTFEGVFLALQHLYTLGHRKIGLVSGEYRCASRSTRLEQYLQFLRNRNLMIEEQWIVRCPYGQEFGYKATLQLLHNPNPPSAIFASNDILAIGAMKAAHDLKIHIPDDISIVGMDDIYAASITTPPLTTIAKCKYEEGWQAALFLLERIRGKAIVQPRKLSFPPRLILRNSTAIPKECAV